MKEKNVVVMGSGRMGLLVKEALVEKGWNCVAVINSETKFSDLDKVSAVAVIDFSLPQGLSSWLPYFVQRRWCLISGTTGLSDTEEQKLVEASHSIAILRASNFSIGIHLLKKAIDSVSSRLSSETDIEIVESHHNQKVDAPSGTALSLAKAIHSHESFQDFEIVSGSTEGRKGKSINIHALRGGNIVGDHEVQFIWKDEIIRLEHQALNRKIFAQGAIACVPFILHAQPGIYSLNDVF